MRGKTEENNKSEQSRLPMEKNRRGIGKNYKSGREKKCLASFEKWHLISKSEIICMGL